MTVIKIDQKWLDARCRRDGDCLLWVKACNNKNLPVAYFQRNYIEHQKSVRKLVWEMKGRILEKGQVLYTTCGDDMCVSHLTAKNRGEYLNANMAADARMRRVASMTRAMRSASKINVGIVEEIKTHQGFAKEMADKHGISLQLIWKIRSGEVWRDITASPFSGLGAR